MYLYADDIFYKNDALNVVGWAGPDDLAHETVFRVTKNGQEVPFTVTTSVRPDVSYTLYQDPTAGELGVFIQIPGAPGDTCVVTASERFRGELLDEKSITVSKRKAELKKKVQTARQFYLSKKKLLNHYLRKDYHQYTRWFESIRVRPEELEEQRNTHFAYEPLISVLVPVYHTPLQFLHRMIQSVLDQSYAGWELCIVNASPDDEELAEMLSDYEELDSRIMVKTLEENKGISGNTNEAFAMARGEFIAMLDHDDMIEPDALFEYVKRINEKPDADLLYCDEDKIRAASDYFFYPNFKPDYDPDMLFNNNYICHMLMVRKTLAEKLGGWRPEFDGAQDYDFILRCITETQKIEHIPRVLYHWRSYQNSTSRNANNKTYAFDASVRAINECYERLGIPAKARPASVAGWYVSDYTLTSEPLVSVLIPSKDHSEDLDTAIRSLEEVCTYKNLEIIVIENNSTEDRTFAYYEEVQKRYANVRVIYYKEGFNYSRINNFGFREAKGDYIMLLNNDVEVITPNLFESMLGYVMRPEVGMVGARLLYKDGTIQHAGVLAGAGGVADHYFKGKKRTKPCYMCRAITTYDVSAVTAACLIMPRSVYEEVDGLDETLAVAFNDADLCMKVRKAGYLIVYDAQAELYHYESKSRGSENTPEKFKRFGGESAYINSKWHMLTGFQDPYYNPNMSYTDYFELEMNLMRERDDSLKKKLEKQAES